ncbi:MAG: protease [Candidatus Muproteobacteria bacterium RIFCSPHIGHO2_12_FULL_60_33]|uniref:Protease n=1 Tax=Candidatus Muproteobacteria bacterium RIFCSPLOWO2_01_FULL_60_18 TaxID=1817768 RepID=A0A1F6U5W7_9PROT|nr:MAG: protease [Candidatus Muproteobacteria bacterium RIFCSPLOWO2_01_FULL_60_18]OGI55451.1 MAG: protease [Candidatus Muproteobacteria bacterium RIFCSPHIGHO2_12_FULL_60_33]OGI61044.1 MAG: protease [Candidatus Muproteobacteria bacterium RIFCSPHIGHO2_01_FULL_61_200]
MKVLIISANRFEDSELLVPYYRLREEGITVDIASLTKGFIKGKHDYEIEANIAIADVRPEQYSALVLPGGKAPAALRENKQVLDAVRAFFKAGKPVSAICHGPQILISAGVLQGRTATCYKSVAEELKAAGIDYQDVEVVVDGNLVTSRQPSDLPAFMRETMKKIRSR